MKEAINRAQDIADWASPGPHRFLTVSNIGLFAQNATHQAKEHGLQDQAMNLRDLDKCLNLKMLRVLIADPQVACFSELPCKQ